MPEEDRKSQEPGIGHSHCLTEAVLLKLFVIDS